MLSDNIELTHYLLVSGTLFTLGLFGALARKNMIVILMSIELMLNAVNIAFIAFGNFNKNVDANVIVIFVMAIAAAEAAVGLALAVNIFKNFKEVNIRFFEHLKG